MLLIYMLLKNSEGSGVKPLKGKFMNTTDSTKKEIIDMPVFVSIFTTLLVIGVIITALRVWSLSSIQGFGYVYYELANVIIVNIPLCYGIIKRKSWARKFAIATCLISVIISLYNIASNNPSVYIAFLRDFPYAFYFIFSKKVKLYFNYQSAENALAENGVDTKMFNKSSAFY